MRTHRWSGAIALAVITLAGCGSTGAPQATPSTTRTVTLAPSTTATTPTTSTSSTRAPDTTVVAPSPVATATVTAVPATVRQGLYLTTPSGRPAVGWTVANEDLELTCGNEPSSMATTSGTYSCGASAMQAFACVADADRAHVLCTTSPWDGTMRRITVDGSLGSTAKPDQPTPLAIELADGSRWRVRVGSAWAPGADDSVAMYGCASRCTEGEALLTGPHYTGGAIIREGETWYARRGPISYTTAGLAKPTKVRIAVAWFLKARPASGTSGALGTVTKPGTVLAKPSDVNKLPDSYDLRSFAAKRLKALNANQECPSTITVGKLDAKSSAAVSEFGDGCGGGEALWGVKNGHWIQVWSGQDVPSCSELRARGATLNPQVVDSCLDSSGRSQAYTP